MKRLLLVLAIAAVACTQQPEQKPFSQARSNLTRAAQAVPSPAASIVHSHPTAKTVQAYADGLAKLLVRVVAAGRRDDVMGIQSEFTHTTGCRVYMYDAAYPAGKAWPGREKRRSDKLAATLRGRGQTVGHATRVLSVGERSADRTVDGTRPVKWVGVVTAVVCP